MHDYIAKKIAEKMVHDFLHVIFAKSKIESLEAPLFPKIGTSATPENTFIARSNQLPECDNTVTKQRPHSSSSPRRTRMLPRQPRYRPELGTPELACALQHPAHPMPTLAWGGLGAPLFPTCHLNTLTRTLAPHSAPAS